MKILIACEYSGRVRDAFIAKGHDAISCDLLPTDTPGPHHTGDVTDLFDTRFDMMIAHPPCTYLTATGNKWFLPEYADRFPNRLAQREEAVAFFMQLVKAPIPKIVIENPVGIMSTRWRKPTQVIQPYMFGEPHAKRTCLWIKGLPRLHSTNIVEPEYVYLSSGKRMPKWYMDAGKLPIGAERSKARSVTFQGIANAMADQWG